MKNQEIILIKNSLQAFYLINQSQLQEQKVQNFQQDFMTSISDRLIQTLHKPLPLTYLEFKRLDGNLQNIKMKQYCFLEQIGEGAFSQVYKAIEQTTNKFVAIKVLNLRQLESEPNPKIKAIKKRLAKQQSKIMMKFNSPNILKCYQCYENRDLKLMVLQYCAEGSLQDQIELDKKISEDEAVSILKQIINGVQQFHKQKIIHRDLKPGNILIHNGEYKIADFGFSKELKIQTENQLTNNTCLGTMITMAPEVLNREPYGLKADIWSVGVIFFYMIFGQCPFKSNNSAEMNAEIVNSSLLTFDQYKGVKPSKEAKSFLRNVLVIDINKRFGWKEVKQHELFTVKKQKLGQNFKRRFDIKARNQELQQLEKKFYKEELQESQLKTDLSSVQQPKFDDLLSNSKDSEYKYINQLEKQENKANLEKWQLTSQIPNKKLNEKQNEKYNEKQLLKNSSNPQSKEDISKKVGPKIENKAIKGQLQYEKCQQSKEQANKLKSKQNQNFRRLNKEEIQNIKKNIHNQNEQFYRWAQKIHVECLKTQAIYLNIIKPIQKYQLLDLKDRQNIELMYLLSARCLNNISPINDLYNKNKSNQIIQDIHYEVQKLYSDVVVTFEKYSSQLTKKENQLSSQFKDWFSKKIFKKQMSIKDRFLTGIESMVEFKPQNSKLNQLKDFTNNKKDLLDYDKEEQIKYTIEYIDEIKKDIKNSENSKTVLKYLNHYQNICQICSEDLKVRSFNDYLTLILM